MHHEGRNFGGEINCTSNLLKRRMSVWAQQSAMGIPAVQGMLLHYIIRADGEVFQRDIEKIFHIRRSTATVLLQAMEQGGFIRREPVSRDARLKQLVPTPKGLEADAAIGRNIAKMELELCKGVSEQEQKAFLETLHKLQQNLIEMEQEEDQRAENTWSAD